MDRTQKLTLASLTVLAVAIILLKANGHPSVANVAAQDDGGNPFIAPYTWNTPGIADTNGNLFGNANPFVSNVNVSVNPDYLGTLSQQYIPLFGFVGVGVTPQLASGNQIIPPSAQPTFGTGSYSSSTSVAASASTFNQPSPFNG